MPLTKTPGPWLFLFVALCGAGCSRKTPAELRTELLQSAAREATASRFTAEQIVLRRAQKLFPSDAEIQYRLGRSYRLSGQAWLSADCLKKAVEIDASHRGAQLELARLMAVSSDKKVLLEARRKVEAALESAPNDAEALSILALVEWRLGERGEAEHHMAEAQTRTPDSLRTALALAEMRLAQQDRGGAEEALRQASKNPRTAQAAFIALGELNASDNRPAEAEQNFRAALARGRDVLPLVSLANFLMRTGRTAEAEPLYRELAARPDPVLRGVHAEFLFRTGRVPEGLKELEEAHAHDPDNRTVRRQLLSAYRAAGKNKELSQKVDALLQRNPKDAEALAERAAFRISAGQLVEARQDLDTVLEFEPNHASAHYLAAKIHQARGETAGRRESLTAALKTDPQMLAARLELAHVLLGSSPRSALDLLDKAPPAQRQDLAWQVERNWALAAAGDSVQLEKGVQRGLEKARVADFLLQQAALQVMKRDFDAARKTAAELLERDPQDVKALEVVVRTRVAENRPNDALRAIEKQVAARPGSARLRAFQGRVLVSLERPEEARRAFEEALRLAPHHLPSQVALASLDSAAGRPMEARQRLQQACERNPQSAAPWLVLGDLEIRAGQPDKALEHYKKALDLEPANLQALNNVADLLSEYAHQPDQALPYALKAKELSPEAPFVLHTLGWILCQRGMWSAGVPHLESAVERQPDTQARYHLALAYARTGRTELGRKMYEEARKSDPSLRWIE